MIFELYTLIDITETKAKRGGDPFLLNQQQNFLTVLNTIGLRANPSILSPPKVVTEFPKFGTKYKNAKHAWRFVFEIEYGSHSVEMLKDDFNLIPIINNLNEDCKIELPVFDTKKQNTINIKFKLVDKYF